MARPFFPAYAFSLVIFVGASVPPAGLGMFQRSHRIFRLLLSDKVLHFLAFGILAFLLCRGYWKSGSRGVFWFKAGFISFFFGLFIEVYQLILPYRMFSVADLGADVAGIAVALAGFRLFSPP